MLDLASSLWSDSAARAVTEFNRTFLYAATSLLFASLADGRRTLRALVPIFAGAFGLLATVAFLARVSPQLVDVTDARTGARAAWPLSAPGALGLVAVVGVALSAAVVVDRERASVSRAAYAA